MITSTAEEDHPISKTDERYIGENVWKYATDNAKLKANDVFQRINKTDFPNLKEKFMVIGSDTIVTYNGEIFGKPKDKEDAKRILKKLSGKSHSVISGVVVILNYNPKDETQNKLESEFYAETEVEFDNLDDDVIDAYVATGEPMDKAGGYGIQAIGGTLVKKINGDYYNVVGFPLNLFCANIRKIYKND